MLGIRNVPDRNRSKFEIIAEILKRLREPVGKTNIMSHCNMSSASSGQYLDFMESIDLVRTDAIAGKVTYEKTEAGQDYLELYSRMALLLDPCISVPMLIQR
jgi:predicted transcriptional regulator